MDRADRISVETVNDFVLSIFWLNGYFLHAADRITSGSGLTTARWQVLGAVLHEPLTVASIARKMGLTRQSVQRTADILVAEGLCEYKRNPAHRRSKLLVSTELGLKSIQRLRPKAIAWSKQLCEQVNESTLNAAILSIKDLISALSQIEEA